MRTESQSYEIWEQGDDVLRHIERCARVSYRSGSRMTGVTAPAFVQSLIRNGHHAALEHGTVYLIGDAELADIVRWNRFAKAVFVEGRTYITVDCRNKMYMDKEHPELRSMYDECVPTVFHEKRLTVAFVLSRAIANEFVRHRAFSFMQESTRWVNFSKERFGHEVTFVMPEEGSWSPVMLESFKQAEKAYFELIDNGVKPQRARDVLPLATKTVLVMTGFRDAWRSFFALRTAKNAHPDAQAIARGLRDDPRMKAFMEQNIGI